MSVSARKITFASLALIALLLSFSACQKEKTAIKQARATAEDFEEAKQVATKLAEDLEMELWAPGPLLSNAVAISLDNNGVAYVAETSRRKSSDLDIRQHRNWMVEDLALQSIEDTKAFHLEKLATELSEENTWQKDFNEDSIHDYRDLEVQSEYIRRIWDSDGDGRADISQLYAEGFNSMLTGVAAGVLNYDDQVYLTAAPDVWKLKDKNKDGIADERSIISSGYGIHIAYAGHDMSGLTIGMDGKIYWSIGDIGVNAVGQDGKRWAYPNQGAVMRCNPDGSEFEVFAHGLRNPQELAFDKYGNLFSADNDGDHRGEKERYMHLLEGSDSGWRINWQYGKYHLPNESYKVWMDEKLYVPHFSGQAAYLLPPLDFAYSGPAGFAFNPGTALSETWKDHFFASFFTASSARSKIQAFKVQPNGASFKIDSIKDVVGGIVPTGIAFGSDGALYINDWKDSYSKKPTGRIWKLSGKDAANNTLQRATEKLLKEGIKNKSTTELDQLIGHPDQRVRMAIQFELVKRTATTTLLHNAQNNKNLFGRLHAIWGIGQLGRKNANAIAALLPFLKDQNEHIRAQVAKVIGDAKYQPAADHLLPLLKDTFPNVQYFAAEALGKLKHQAAFQEMVDLLAKIEENDPHLRHGLIFALSKLAVPTSIANLVKHPSKYVRIAATVVLRHQASPLIADFLKDTESLVLTEAARAIHDDFSIPEALPALAKTLDNTSQQNEAFLRRAINANLRLGDAASAQRLAKYAQSKAAPEAMRQDALWALGYWADPPNLDRVDGRFRPIKGHKLGIAQKFFASIFQTLINTKNTNIQTATIEAAGRLEYQPANKKVFAIFKNKNIKTNTRKTALLALAKMNTPNLEKVINLALEDKELSIRKEAQGLLEQVNLEDKTKLALLEKIFNQNSISEKQKALVSIAKLKLPLAQAILKRSWDKYTDGKLDKKLQLDVLMAIENSAFEDLKQQKSIYEKKLGTDNLLAQYKSTLYGGNQQAGAKIFAKNTSAQCLRCHAVNGKGGDVGPPLENIAAQLDRKNLLLALIDPNERIAPGYGTIILKLKNGTEITGILKEETDTTYNIQKGDEPVQTIIKSNISEKEILPSGMFDMTTILTKAQIRDLMAFLVTLEK